MISKHGAWCHIRWPRKGHCEKLSGTTHKRGDSNKKVVRGRHDPGSWLPIRFKIPMPGPHPQYSWFNWTQGGPMLLKSPPGDATMHHTHRYHGPWRNWGFILSTRGIPWKVLNDIMPHTFKRSCWLLYTNGLSRWDTVEKGHQWGDWQVQRKWGEIKRRRTYFESIRVAHGLAGTSH